MHNCSSPGEWDTPPYHEIFLNNFRLTLGAIEWRLRAQPDSMDTLMQATLRVREMGRSTNRVCAVAACEDSTTEARVNEFCINLARQLGTACEFNKQMWLLTELRVPRLRAIAVEDAAQADLLLIAVHHCEEPPDELQNWLEQWLAKKGNRTTLLLALLDPVYSGVSAGLRTYLENIARKAPSEFLVQSEDGVSYA